MAFRQMTDEELRKEALDNQLIAPLDQEQLAAFAPPAPVPVPSPVAGGAPPDADQDLMANAPPVKYNGAVEPVPSPPAPTPDDFVGPPAPPPETGAAGPTALLKLLSNAPATTPADDAQPPLGGQLLDVYKSFAPQLQHARDVGAQQRLIAGLGRAGAMVSGALGHTEANMKPYDAIETEAGLPEKQIEGDRSSALMMAKLAQAAAKAKEKAAQEDLTSYQTALINQHPDILTKLGRGDPRLGEILFRGLTRKQAEDVMNFGFKQTGQEETKGQHVVTNNRNATNDAFNHNMGERRQGLAESNSANVQSGRENALLGGYVRDQKAQEPVFTTFKTIEQLMPGAMASGKVPSAMSEREGLLRALPFSAGSNFTSPQVAALQSAIDMLHERIMRPMAGANLTKQENDFYKRVFQSGVLKNPAAQLAILNMFRHDLYNHVKTGEAGPKSALFRTPGGADLWNDYVGREGITTQHPIFSDFAGSEAAAPTPAPTRTPSAAPKIPPGIKPPPGLKFTGQTRPRKDGSVWAELSDGTAMMLNPPTRTK